jgi:hypothetical protein
MVALSLFLTAAPAQTKITVNMLRDSAIEDEVAKTFESARKSAGAKPLKRIKYRDEVQGLVCTAALNDRVPLYAPGAPAVGPGKRVRNPVSVLYKTTEPAKLTPEITRLAALDPNHQLGFKRYAVAVWRSPNELGQPQEYWVGIQFYWSTAFEFFDYHFTDDVWYRNTWKDAAAKPCRKL